MLFFFPLLVAVECIMKREQRQQIISPTCGFAAKASGKLVYMCLAVLADHILQLRRPEAASGRTLSLLLVGTYGSV